MTLTPEQLAKRDGKLTASRVGVLMSGDEHKILNLWRELVGDPDYVPDDNLDDVWAVQLGSHTESLNLDWYERRTGRRVADRGKVVIHELLPWAAATLDGWDCGLRCPIECKHVGGYEKRETIVARYQPQCHWLMAVTGKTCVIMSIIEGAKEPVLEEVHWDADYGVELLRRAQDFWHAVVSLTPPVEIPALPPPVQATREVDMHESNAWCSWAMEWLLTKTDAQRFDVAAKELKELTPKDSKRAFGQGIEITRAKNGALTIRADK